MMRPPPAIPDGELYFVTVVTVSYFPLVRVFECARSETTGHGALAEEDHQLTAAVGGGRERREGTPELPGTFFGCV